MFNIDHGSYIASNLKIEEVYLNLMLLVSILQFPTFVPKNETHVTASVFTKAGTILSS